jgi:hypothetical protein
VIVSVCRCLGWLAEQGGLWSRLWSWAQEHSTLLFWLGSLSIVSGIFTLLALPIVVGGLAADYFVATRTDLAERRRPLLWVEHALRNVIGVVFVLAGVVMLVLPGQGLLTILIGLLLVDFPGKRALELRLVRRPRLLAFLNRMRARRGRPPLQIE